MLGQHRLYDFRLQTEKDWSDALAALVQNQPALGNMGVPIFEKMYKYINAIAGAYTNPPTHIPKLALQNTVLSFLDKETIREFLEDPIDQEIRDALSIQLIMMASALHVSPIEIHSYTNEELDLILKGEGLYDDGFFALTVHDIISDDLELDDPAKLVRTLLPLKDQEDRDRQFFWNDAFMFSLMMHGVWKTFPNLNDNDQQFLLQNYFYQGIVCGAPVRFSLQEAAMQQNAGGKGQAAIANYLRVLSENKEFIPLNTDNFQGKKLSILVPEFLGKVAGGEEIGTIAQERYINSYYRDQVNRDAYSAWLREALSIILRLRNGNIVEYV